MQNFGFKPLGKDNEDGQESWPIIIRGSFEMFPESLYF
jgi:hypothetical protein